MATSKSGSFWLTERINIASADLGTPQVGTIDLGSYVDVGDQQALSIEEVDYQWQGVDSNGNAQMFKDAVTADTELLTQLSDLNPGSDILFADSNSLVSSGSLYFDSVGGFSHQADLFPDSYGKLSESRLVVNDQLYVVASGSGTIAAGEAVACTIRIKARIAKLSTKDWMAIAIQSTAADN
jgi:hypothetical protein